MSDIRRVEKTQRKSKMNCSNLCGQYKNRVYGKKNKILSNILTSFFKRSQFCF